MKPHAFTIWLTGLSGSGKSTLAQALEVDFQTQGKPSAVIDGDALRQGLCQDLGFSRADRQENIRRAAELCKHLNDAGVVAIGALISPYTRDREQAGEVIGPSRFIEVHLSTPLEVCEARDPKGLYRRARAGQIGSFTGIDDPYQVPVAPAFRLDTSRLSVNDCLEQIRRHLQLRPVFAH